MKIKNNTWLKKLFANLISLICTPIYLLLLFIRPFCKVKFGNIYSSRIGHLCELHQIIVLKKFNKEREIYLISFTKPIVNKYLHKIISKEKNYIEINSTLGKYFSIFLKLINDNKIDLDLSGKKYFYNLNKYIEYKTYIKPIYFNKSDFGQHLDQAIKSNKLVCIHNRDNSLVKTQNLDINYHNFRNSDPDKYQQLIQNFINKGYFVIRMGRDSDKKIILKDKNFIDYTSSKYNCEFNDILLLSNCKYYIGSDSGISIIPRIFGKKSYFCNYPINQTHQLTFFHEGFFLPKSILSINDNKPLSLNNLFKEGLYKFYKNEEFNKLNFKLIENTEEELLNFSNEILSLEDIKNYKETKEQKEFNLILKSLCKRYGVQLGNISSIISRDFIEKNIYLLE